MQGISTSIKIRGSVRLWSGVTALLIERHELSTSLTNQTLIKTNHSEGHKRQARIHVVTGVWIEVVGHTQMCLGRHFAEEDATGSVLLDSG